MHDQFLHEHKLSQTLILFRMTSRRRQKWQRWLDFLHRDVSHQVRCSAFAISTGSLPRRMTIAKSPYWAQTLLPPSSLPMFCRDSSSPKSSDGNTFGNQPNSSKSTHNSPSAPVVTTTPSALSANAWLRAPSGCDLDRLL